MMKFINEKTRQSSSIHKKIRSASFISYESEDTKTFKYKYLHRLEHKFNDLVANSKRKINTIIQKPHRWMNEIDWAIARNDFIESLIKICIEGTTANIATHYLLGLPFNPGMIIAHGIAINQGLDIYWRLKKDGPITKIPKKHD